MRFLGLVGLIGMFLSIVYASAASADQCPARESPIVTDRPDVTNSSLVVPEGSFQSENGINFTNWAAATSLTALRAGYAGALCPDWRCWSTSPHILLPYAVR